MSEQNFFFPGPPDPSFYGFYNGNAEYERQFFRNAYDSYPGSRYRHQYSEETAARQSPSLASMEASQSPSLASIPSVESSNSGGNNNTNDSKGKKKVKYETWSQAEQKLLVQLWAENHELLESREARTAWRKISENLNHVPSRVQQDRGKVYEENEIPN